MVYEKMNFAVLKMSYSNRKINKTDSDIFENAGFDNK